MTPVLAVVRYGPIVKGRWANEPNWCVSMPVPDDFAHVVNTASGLPWTHVYLNRDMHDPLLRALQNVVDAGLAHEVETFDGCYMIRDIRGQPGSTSAHSYAMAIDLNARLNPLGAVPTWSEDLVHCFKDEGFAWGGDFKRLDGMHFSLAGW